MGTKLLPPGCWEKIGTMRERCTKRVATIKGAQPPKPQKHPSWGAALARD